MVPAEVFKDQWFTVMFVRVSQGGSRQSAKSCAKSLRWAAAPSAGEQVSVAKTCG